jgi:hypothetical protein
VDFLAVAGTSLFVASSSGGAGTVLRISTTGNGLPDPNWNSGQFGSYSPDPSLKAIRSLAASADSVYVGGDFDWINGSKGYSARSGLVKLNATSDIDSLWGKSFTSHVQALAMDESNVYVTGTFGLARMSATGTGGIDSAWVPDVASGFVNVLALSGTNLFAGGWITTASGLSNATLVRLGTTGSGAIDPTWNPNPHRSNSPINITRSSREKPACSS